VKTAEKEWLKVWVGVKGGHLRIQVVMEILEGFGYGPQIRTKNPGWLGAAGGNQPKPRIEGA